ncbi:hypothetical protein [Brasilonema sp. UFV-L1]|uniref:hypothetical protein n=1 Tax=Brasilonema sp. UFV-L1 TaxID=2234130 RepID=UPI002006EB54|nr:hypothetical protein [Brasilonema sp. UFV-L1]
MIENILHCNQLLALIVSNSFQKSGIHFFTPNNLSQQLAYMHHPTGKVIQPHVHNSVRREIIHTQEVLFLKKGKLRVDFYNDQQQYLESRILEAGDVILLVSGGHGFEVLEEIEMIEVKQGPYVGEQDKTRFSGITSAQVKIAQLNQELERIEVKQNSYIKKEDEMSLIGIGS